MFVLSGNVDSFCFIVLFYLTRKWPGYRPAFLGHGRASQGANEAVIVRFSNTLAFRVRSVSSNMGLERTLLSETGVPEDNEERFPYLVLFSPHISS